MGEVYAAKDTKLGRKEALKMLSPNLAADSDRRARFQREAKLVATLNHPTTGSGVGSDLSRLRAWRWLFETISQESL